MFRTGSTTAPVVCYRRLAFAQADKCVVRVASQHLRDLADVGRPMAGLHQMRHRSSVAADLTACGECRASVIAVGSKSLASFVPHSTRLSVAYLRLEALRMNRAREINIVQPHGRFTRYECLYMVTPGGIGAHVICSRGSSPSMHSARDARED